VAAGERPRGRQPAALEDAHAGQVASARRTTPALRSLTTELHTLLEVVVLRPTGALDAPTRQGELDALLDLVAEVRDPAGAGHQAHRRSLPTTLSRALPAALAVVAGVERGQPEVRRVVGERGLALIAWAWQRRSIGGPRTEEVVAGLPEAGRHAARVLGATWDGAARASRAVANGHSILRPHLAVHRTLSAGVLALLAVWHHHRAFPRGAHRGSSPLQVSGMPEVPADWVVALGYPPAPDAAPPAGTPAVPPLALAA
jgi:hypothetical protein